MWSRLLAFKRIDDVDLPFLNPMARQHLRRDALAPHELRPNKAHSIIIKNIFLLVQTETSGYRSHLHTRATPLQTST